MVIERLREDIIDGTLAAGTQLSEVELAKSFGVSRGPIREALQRLIQEGLLRGEPHRRVSVPVLTKGDVADIYLARTALESAAVQSIIASAKSEETYKELDRNVRLEDAAEAAGDWEAVKKYDLEFHTILVAASGSQRLQRMFSTVISETRLCMGALTGEDVRHHHEAQSPSEVNHRKISELIRDGDTVGALAALKKHFDDAVLALTSRDSEDDEELAATL
ncbi:GntR family transcriptional regulator [Streptomyces sp. DT2A-34]|uniref:GntR family transcriptional regulator n=1 Tax=Streptomyces sp. DT2A-34 TaxID=3051182 RepID=UPI00265C5B93|nr:GntR family transcriptional regulator [Streptomyces sp. DT2A-34]MDO0916671.1 GntR family transcriptional regulator [Streptomyces sp. DT2A-34]